MNLFLNRIELVFFGILGLTVIGIVAFQVLWLNPSKQCESSGNWWDSQSRSCAHVVYLPDITHRPIGSKAMPAYPGLPKSRDQAAEANSAPAR